MLCLSFPRAVLVRMLPVEILSGTGCTCLEHIRCVGRARDSSSISSASHGMGCQGLPGEQFRSTVEVPAPLLGLPQDDPEGGTGSRAGQIPAQMGQAALKPAKGPGSVRLLLSLRTKAGQSKARDLGASVKYLLVPQTSKHQAHCALRDCLEPVTSCSWQPACGTWHWHSCPAEPHSPSLAEKPEWFSELPYFWTKVQVLEWISYHVEKNKYDASCIDFSCCNMDGHALCHCTRDQMRLIFGPLGDELYDRLHEISECHSAPFVPRPGSSDREPEITSHQPKTPCTEEGACGRLHWGDCNRGCGDTEQN